MSTQVKPNIHQYHQVKSANIKAVGYDPQLGIMDVIFVQDPKMMYRYQNVTPTIYAQMMSAASIGSMFAQMIRKNAKLHPFTVHDAPDLK